METGDDEWQLTDDKIASVLADLVRIPAPLTACCEDDGDRLRFRLHIIGRKALEELQRHRATMRRVEEWAERLAKNSTPGRIVADVLRSVILDGFRSILEDAAE